MADQRHHNNRTHPCQEVVMHRRRQRLPTLHRSAPHLSQLWTASIIKGLALMVMATSALAQAPAAVAADGVYDLLVGTYTGPNSEGMYVYRFDTKTGAATRIGSVRTVNPS